MRTHRAKSAHLTAEYIPPTFWLEAPSPFYAGSSWGLLSRKIFFIFLTSFWIFIFFLISLVFIECLDWEYFSRLSYSISTRILFFYFFYSRLDSCFDSVFQIILFNYFDSIKVRHLILDSIFRNIHRFDSFDFRSIFLVCSSLCLLASISTCFSIVYSML